MHESGHVKGSKETKKVLQNQNSNFEEADFKQGNGSEDTKAPRNHETTKKKSLSTQTMPKDLKGQNIEEMQLHDLKNP